MTRCVGAGAVQNCPRPIRATRAILLATASASLMSGPPTFSSHHRRRWASARVSAAGSATLQWKESQIRPHLVAHSKTYIARSSSASSSSGRVKRSPMPSCCRRMSSGISFLRWRSSRFLRAKGGPIVEMESILRRVDHSHKLNRLRASTLTRTMRPARSRLDLARPDPLSRHPSSPPFP